MRAGGLRPDPQLRRVRRDVFAGVAIGLALCLSVLFADWMVASRAGTPDRDGLPRPDARTPAQ